MKKGNIDHLYYIDTEIDYHKLNNTVSTAYRVDKLVSVPIIKETNKYYYVSMFANQFKTAEEFRERISDMNCLKCCYKVDKNTMKAVSKPRQYFTHPFIAKENYFVERNAYKIGQALGKCKNAYLLRQVAHNLELGELEELNIGETK